MLTVLDRSNSALRSPTFLGVVVTQALGHSPRRNANCIISHVSCAFGHFANSSAQTASNCGPRKRSGSNAENKRASAPFGQTNICRPATHFGILSGGEHANIPLSPNTITSRACSIVSPIRPTLRAWPGSRGRDPSTIDLTHSAPARVFPAPRPPKMTQDRQSPSGGN